MSDAMPTIILAADFPYAVVIGAVSTFLMTVMALITYIAKAIFVYLIDRIKVLETRQEQVLTGVVESIENISGSVKTTADYTIQLIEEMKYRERRKAEEMRGRS